MGKWEKQVKWKKLKPEGQYVPLSYETIDSLAWKELNGSSMKVYLKMCTFNHIGNINFTYRQAKKWCNLSRDGFRKAITQLEKLGFIDILSSGHYRKPNIYALSKRWKLYGQEAYLDKHESRGNNFFDV